ncbi:MAG: CHASE2 domain-containing protein [Symploca sp. SIO3C6]|nr:CHASE2 domain-containing protein [Symploca sp. SIO3C6]
MKKLVVLRLDSEPESPTVRVNLTIESQGTRPWIEMTSFLPRSRKLTTKTQEHWQEKYRNLGAPYRLQPKNILYDGSINAKREECQQSATKLQEMFREWLDSESFRPLEKRLRAELSRDEEIRLLIRTQDQQLQKLPWHLWDFFEHYPHAEVALGSTKIEPTKVLTKPKRKNKITILAILGHSEGLDLEKDRSLLTNLPNAETLFLVEPKREEINDKLWEQSWDIIFFAGHSQTEGETGRIYINPTDSLTIDELWYALRKAVEKGLKLAIFNSCDGLGLARRLDDVQIPQMIVMRELVPDEVAQKFLRHFLQSFADGKSLYLAAREARERLQGIESEFPCASWLPVICQNQLQVPPSWEDLLKQSPLEPDQLQVLPSYNHKPWRRIAQNLLLASFAVTAMVTGLRNLGALQSWELKAFDQLMRLRPQQEPDQRLLLVTITEEDVQSQPSEERDFASLSDRSLAQLLTKLEQYQPRVIGLDIYRDQPVGSQYTNLAQQMANSNTGQTPFFAICKYGNPGVSPPPEVTKEGHGFDNILLDPDGIIRRHLLAVESPAPCQNDSSFSLQLATRYLADEGIELKITPQQYIQLGKTVFKTLSKDSGGYRNLDTLGHQVLLNYRPSHEIAEKVTLKEILSDQFNANLVKNRIVLIGTIAPSFNNHHWRTPYSSSKGSIETLTGIEIQAHMVSHILSSVLNERPLIWWWSDSGEVLWIFCWSAIGGLLAWKLRSPVKVILGTGAAFSILYSICLGLVVLKSGWVPLVPSVLALVVTGSCVVFSVD